jgi:hypothetical protein
LLMLVRLRFVNHCFVLVFNGSSMFGYSFV